MRFLEGFGYFLTSEEIRKSRLLLHPLVHGSQVSSRSSGMSSEKVLQSILGMFAEIGEHVFDNRYVEMF